MPRAVEFLFNLLMFSFMLVAVLIFWAVVIVAVVYGAGFVEYVRQENRRVKRFKKNQERRRNTPMPFTNYAYGGLGDRPPPPVIREPYFAGRSLRYEDLEPDPDEETIDTVNEDQFPDETNEEKAGRG